QMRAQYHVDVLGSHASCAQPIEIRRVKLMEAGEARPILVVAGAAVQQDGMVIRPDQPRMDAGDQTVMLGRIMVRSKPTEMSRQRFALEAREVALGRQARTAELFLDTGYPEISDRPSRRRHFQALEHFPEKWMPVFRRKCDQVSTSRPLSDSTQSESGLV